MFEIIIQTIGLGIGAVTALLSFLQYKSARKSDADPPNAGSTLSGDDSGRG